MFLIGTSVFTQYLAVTQTTEQYKRDISEEIRSTLNLLEKTLAKHANAENFPLIQQVLDAQIKREFIERAEWHDARGFTLVAHSPATAHSSPAWFNRWLNLEPVTHQRTIRVNGTTYGRIILYCNAAQWEKALWKSTFDQIGVQLLSLALMLALLSLILRRNLHPLEGMTKSAREFLAGDNNLRGAVSTGTAPEICDFVTTLNHAADRVESMLLSLSEQRRATDNAALMVEYDPQGRLIYANDKFCEMSRYTRDELIDSGHWASASRYYPGKFSDELWLTVSQGKVWHGEEKFLSKDGRELWMDNTVTPVLGRSGKLSKFVSIRFDITKRRRVEEALRESATSLRRAQQIAHLGNWEWNVECDELVWSRQVYRIFGQDPDRPDASMEAFMKAVHPRDRTTVKKALDAALQKNLPFSLDHRITLPNGSQRVVHQQAQVEGNAAEKAVRVYGTIQDITNRKRTEDALRESEEKFKGISSNVPGMVFQLCLGKEGQLTFQFASEATHALCGLAPSEVCGDASLFSNLIVPEDHDVFRQSMRRSVCTLLPWNWEGRIHVGGSDKWVNLRARPRLLASGDVIWDGIVFNITENKLAELEIKWSREQLQELSSYLQAVREDEKRCIAREIHDELGSTLTSLKMDIAWLARNIPSKDGPIMDKISSMSEITGSATQTMRKIVTELRPTILDDLGLAAAVEWQVREFEKRSDIRCELILEPDELAMEGTSSIALFRMLQESLTNIARHAHATRVAVHMCATEAGVTLEIHDNGRGMERATDIETTSHGIRGMAERTRSLGGTLAIRSAPGQGVTVSIQVPWEKNREEWKT